VYESFPNPIENAIPSSNVIHRATKIFTEPFASPIAKPFTKLCRRITITVYKIEVGETSGVSFRPYSPVNSFVKDFVPLADLLLQLLITLVSSEAPILTLGSVWNDHQAFFTTQKLGPFEKSSIRKAHDFSDGYTVCGYCSLLGPVPKRNNLLLRP
jgi:hypothetical protein